MANLKVQVVCLNFRLISSPYRVLELVVHFGDNLVEHVKGRPTTKLKSLIELPYVTRLKVHVLRFNMNLISSP